MYFWKFAFCMLINKLRAKKIHNCKSTISIWQTLSYILKMIHRKIHPPFWSLHMIPHRSGKLRTASPNEKKKTTAHPPASFGLARSYPLTSPGRSSYARAQHQLSDHAALVRLRFHAPARAHMCVCACVAHPFGRDADRVCSPSSEQPRGRWHWIFRLLFRRVLVSEREREPRGRWCLGLILWRKWVIRDCDECIWASVWGVTYVNVELCGDFFGNFVFFLNNAP